ncbi:hypothetical protein [Aeromonas veronii]|uniref:hypothetical protein n=1 Tax=Aeromonas veronii TaxID=654 RepID=UPI002B4A7E09|nr:hypothetical protein [Aeromonas veronii]
MKQSKMELINLIPCNQKIKDVANSAEIVFYPLLNFREQVEQCFYVGTIDLFQYVISHMPQEHSIAIACDEDQYQEIALCSKLHRLGIYIISFIAAPIFVNVISNYISGQLKASHDDQVEINIIIESKDGNTQRIEYLGSAEKFITLSDKINALVENNK